MGLITRQTIKGSVYSYLGAVIGFVNVAILMPHIFTTQEVGLTNILISVSAIFGQFGTLGFVSITTRLFPYFRNKEKKNNGFLFMLLVAGLAGFFICSMIYFFIKPYLISENVESSPLFAEYVYLLLPLIFITIFHLLIDTYNRVLFNASFGAFVKELFLRILNFLGIILFYFNVFDFHTFIIYYTAVYAIPVILISLLLIYKQDFSLKPDFRFPNIKLKKEIISVGTYGVLTGFSGIAAMHIDRYMVNHFCDLGSTGIYATAFFFGTMILLPGRALLRIATTSITEAFKVNDQKTVLDIYKKSTINQMIIAMFLFALVWVNIDNIMQIMPAEYVQGKYVIFYISMSYFFLMSGGVSSEIIQFGKHYKVYTLMMLLLIALIVIFNFWLIPIYGITGAAIASMLSYLIYCVIKFVFLYFRFKYQPYNEKHFLVIIIGIASYFAAYIVPYTDLLVLDIIIKSATLAIVFAIPSYYFKVSDEINKLLNDLISKFKK